LPTVSLVHIVTQWTGSGGTEAYLGGQLASFSALTLLVGSFASKNRPRNDLKSVEWDVKPLLNQPLTTLSVHTEPSMPPGSGRLAYASAHCCFVGWCHEIQKLLYGKPGLPHNFLALKTIPQQR